MFGYEEEHYKYWWSGENKKRGDVGILIEEDLVEVMVQVERINSRTRELTRVFSGIVDEGDIPKEWKNSVTVPIY